MFVKAPTIIQESIEVWSSVKKKIEENYVSRPILGGCSNVVGRATFSITSNHNPFYNPHVSSTGGPEQRTRPGVLTHELPEAASSDDEHVHTGFRQQEESDACY